MVCVVGPGSVVARLVEGGGVLLHAPDSPAGERSRSMARGQEIIHTAGVHRESIASDGSASAPESPPTSYAFRFYRFFNPFAGLAPHPFVWHTAECDLRPRRVVDEFN